MTLIEHHVSSARRQLLLNRFLRLLGWSLCGGAGGFALTVLVQRLFDIGLPLGWLALGWAGLVAMVAGIWSRATQASAGEAATALDEAAGLKERISSGFYCARSDDPFARAVVADAERVGAGLTVRRHLPICWPHTLGYAGAAVLAASMMLLLPQWDVLARPREDEHKLELAKRAEVAQAHWEKELEEIKRTAKDNPLLKNNVAELEDMSTGRIENPEDVRRETLKRFEALKESVERQRGETRYQSMEQLKRMLAQIPQKNYTNSQVNQLADALSKGDFSEAKKALEQMQEQLAKADDPKNEELRKELQEQLAELGKKLEQLSAEKKLEQELKGEGLSKEQIERLLAQLDKKDIESIKKQLQQQGMTQQKAEQLARQLAKSQAARQKAQQLAKSLCKCAAASASGAEGDMQEGMGDALDQLSEMEQIELQLAEMNATLAGLEQAADDARQPCSYCNGTGMVGDKPCPKCGGTGMQRSGMGVKPGQGQGGLAPEQQTGIGFKRERTPVKTTKGRIVGKFFVDGEQYKGDVSPEYREAVISGQREATEALENEQVPPQYQKALKEYFTRLGGGTPPPADKPDESGEQP